MTPAAPILTTARLLLRPLTLADADDLLEYQSDAATVRYIPWPQRSRDDVLQALEAHATKAVEAPAADGEFALLAWTLRDGGKVIGQSNLSIESQLHRHASIGWVTHPAYLRRGFATEATRALLDWAFGALDLHRVTATIDTRNVASARLAERLGMRLEALHVEDEWFKGEWTSTWTYALLEREWPATG